MTHQSQNTNLSERPWEGGQYLLHCWIPQPQPRAWWAAGVQSVLAKRGHLFTSTEDIVSMAGSKAGGSIIAEQDGLSPCRLKG